MKPKLFYLLSNVGHLEPVSGDRINEMNLIRSLSKQFDVYYNGVLVDPQTSVFGLLDRKAQLPDQIYDCYYVRANKEIFLQLPSPKIWMCVPYFEECYQQADAVACITQYWADRLRYYNYSHETEALFCGVYPERITDPKKIIITHQVIDTNSFSSANIDSEWVRSNINPARITIGHFGRVVKSNYPYQLAKMSRMDVWNKFEAIFIGKISEPLPLSFNVFDNIPSANIKGLIKACDYIIYSQDLQGRVAGSLKVLEAMAAGIPVISPRYPPREQELGTDYPYFWELKEGSDITEPDQPGFYKIIDLITNRPDIKKEWSKILVEKSKVYDIHVASNYLCNQILSVI